MKRLPQLAASLAVVLTLTTACGGDGRPSADEIADSLKSQSEDVPAAADLPDDAIDWDCLGEVYHDSDLSDEALQAIVDGDEDYEPSGDDEKAVTDAVQDSADCYEIPQDEELQDQLDELDDLQQELEDGATPSSS